jgi:hypothetical protein
MNSGIPHLLAPSSFTLPLARFSVCGCDVGGPRGPPSGALVAVLRLVQWHVCKPHGRRRLAPGDPLDLLEFWKPLHVLERSACRILHLCPRGMVLFCCCCFLPVPLRESMRPLTRFGDARVATRARSRETMLKIRSLPSPSHSCS